MTGKEEQHQVVAREVYVRYMENSFMEWVVSGWDSGRFTTSGVFKQG